MISGAFKDGRPFVQLGALGGPVKRPTGFEAAISPGRLTTLLTAGDLGLHDDPVLFAPDDTETASDLFGALPSRRLRVLLTFHHDDGRPHVEQAEVLVVPGPPGESRLGADLLARWVVVLDGPAGTVMVEPEV